MIVESQHVPSIVGFHAFAVGVHCIQVMRADGNMVRKSVITQNHTNHRMGPVVNRSSVTPKDIFEKVDAKQEIEAPMDVYRAMVRTLLGSMSTVRFPNPSSWPICVMMASISRRI